MIESAPFRKQFLLTKNEEFSMPWKRAMVDDYNLFYHPDLEFEHVSGISLELYLLGFLFDYRKPEYSNRDILNELASATDFEGFILNLAECSGHFIIIFRQGNKLILIADAGGQRELYYDTSFSTFGSQVKLLTKIVSPVPHSDKDANDFYSSAEFYRRKEYINDTTQFENIKHLLPNFFIDIKEKKTVRYFPGMKMSGLTLKDTAAMTSEMLKGYIKAASLRYNLTMGVTGGYDSRVLFISSLDTECKYYVTKRNFMDDSHYDITIPSLLTKTLGKNFTVISEREDLDPETKNALEESVDFARTPKKTGSYFDNCIILNGNLSEITRNAFEYPDSSTGRDLAFIYGFSDNKFVLKEYKKWLDDSADLIRSRGYSIMDFFYWEHRMGNWAAKSKSEMDILGTLVYSPFSSHKLLNTILSLNKKYRDTPDNKLYNLIIKESSPVPVNIPVNPGRKNSVIKIMKHLHLFRLFQLIRLKYGLRKPYYLQNQNYA